MFTYFAVISTIFKHSTSYNTIFDFQIVNHKRFLHFFHLFSSLFDVYTSSKSKIILNETGKVAAQFAEKVLEADRKTLSFADLEDMSILAHGSSGFWLDVCRQNLKGALNRMTELRFR